MLAARELEAGAIVLTGISPMEAFYGQGLPAYQGIVTENGDGLRKSNFDRLYENALRWLAKHGKEAKELGQGELAPLKNEGANRRRLTGARTCWAANNVPSPARA